MRTVAEDTKGGIPKVRNFGACKLVESFSTQKTKEARKVSFGFVGKILPQREHLGLQRHFVF